MLWLDFIHTQLYAYYTKGPVDWHTHINIYLHQLLCAHLYYIEWIIKNLLSNVFSFQKLLTCQSHICWLDAHKTFLWNTNNTDGNGVNKQKTHTHAHTKHSEKDNTEKGWLYEKMWYPLFKNNPSYFTTPSLFMEKIWTPPLFENFKNSNPLYIGGTNYVDGWVFVYNLSGCGFESHCSHLKKIPCKNKAHM